MDSRVETAKRNLRTATLDLLASLEESGCATDESKAGVLECARQAVSHAEHVLGRGAELKRPYRPTFIDPRCHRVLEHDPESGYALIYLGDESQMPFVVCYDYDPALREWSQGHYFEHARDAAVDFERCTGMNRVESVPEGCICTVRWCEGDLMRHLRALGECYATKENLDKCKSMIGGTLRDRSIEEGWQIIDDLVDQSRLSRG